MVIAALLIGAGIIIAEVCAVMRAPLGYQDETGFHVGAQNADEETTGCR